MNYFRVLAQMLQDEGRGRDTVLAHITPEEAALLKRRGGRGSVNPVTGLLEFEDGDGDGGTGGGSSGDGGGDGGDSSPGGGDGGNDNGGGGYDGVFIPGANNPTTPTTTTQPTPSRVSQAFMDMLAANRNLAPPTVTFSSNYAPRTVTPAAPLLNGTWVPITNDQAPAAPMVFSGDLGGYRGGGSFGAVQSPVMTAPTRSAPLSPSDFRAPSVTPDQVSALRSPASEGLSAYADYLRRVRGY